MERKSKKQLRAIRQYRAGGGVFATRKATDEYFASKESKDAIENQLEQQGDTTIVDLEQDKSSFIQSDGGGVLGNSDFRQKENGEEIDKITMTSMTTDSGNSKPQAIGTPLNDLKWNNQAESNLKLKAAYTGISTSTYYRRSFKSKKHLESCRKVTDFFKEPLELSAEVDETEDNQADFDIAPREKKRIKKT